MHFKNSVIWITGASSGIGRELAMQLAQQKPILILTARSIEELNQVKEGCTQALSCTILASDLTKDNLEALTSQAIALHGRIDIFINSAGISQRSLAMDTNVEVYRELMEINYFAPVRITKALLPHFKKNKSGQLVVLSSMAGLLGFPMRTGYAAAKHALKGFYETLQVEHTIPEFYITIISPGRVNTPISTNALTGNGTPYNKMDEAQLNGISTKKCVQKIIKAIEQKKRHVLIAKEERILWWFWKNLRFLYYHIARKKGLKK